MAEKQLIVVVEGTAAMGPFWQTVVSDYVEKIVRYSSYRFCFKCYCSNGKGKQNCVTMHFLMLLIVFFRVYWMFRKLYLFPELSIGSICDCERAITWRVMISFPNSEIRLRAHVSICVRVLNFNWNRYVLDVGTCLFRDYDTNLTIDARVGDLVLQNSRFVTVLVWRDRRSLFFFW